MKLGEALKIINAADKARPELPVFLACSFTPLHLATFLAAEMQVRSERRVRVATGLFGDLIGNVQRIKNSGAEYATVVIEWQDLDARFDVRRLAPWTWRDLPEIVEASRQALASLRSAIEDASSTARIVVVTPNLPFPLLAPQDPESVSPLQAEVEQMIAEFRSHLTKLKNVVVLVASGESAADWTSAERFGFPYSIAFAATLAERISSALISRPRMKGIIVDLDGTLWKGIIGDDGIENVHWDLDHGALSHGILQRVLHALAHEGVLVAIATKNTESVIESAFAQRSDLVLKREDVFPLVANWGSKSASIGQILQTWNINADAVVFIDDNRFELDQVQAEFPTMQCLQFQDSVESVQQLWKKLRQLFATASVGKEDEIRSQSLRAGQMFQVQQESAGTKDSFLQQLDSTITLEFSRDPDARAFELINKTNQFNMNGGRLSEREFQSFLERDSAFLLTCSYADKFGVLGKIAVLLGEKSGSNVQIKNFVMSCRAFSRRIEFACLAAVYEFFDSTTLQFEYKKTDRNQPFQEFLSTLFDSYGDGILTLTADQFRSSAPASFHKVSVLSKIASAAGND